MENLKGIIEKIWLNETETRRNAITIFLKKYYGSAYESRPHYDPIKDFHISGGNQESIDSISRGVAEIQEVSVLYSNKNPEQIHVVINGGLDIYIQNRALSDFLERR